MSYNNFYSESPFTLPRDNYALYETPLDAAFDSSYTLASSPPHRFAHPRYHASESEQSISVQKQQALDHITWLLDQWFPKYSLTIENATCGTDGRVISISTDTPSSSASLTSICPTSITASNSTSPGHALLPSYNTPSSAAFQKLPTSNSNISDKGTSRTFTGSDDIFLNTEVTKLLISIFSEWGIDFYAVETKAVLSYLRSLILSSNIFSGTVSKKFAVCIMQNLYPCRRKMFPYAKGQYPAKSWPNKIPYKDPSHLNRNERLALMIWAYGNPEHDIETIIAVHNSTKEKCGIVIDESTNIAFLRFRECLERQISIG